MTAPKIWQSIARSLRDDIAGGGYAPGDRLPSEAALSRRFGVNRHTVRHALATLAAAGEVRSRRGSGVFVAARPTDYPLGERVRFHQNLLASGRSPSRRFLHMETRPATQGEAQGLGLATGVRVHLVEGLSFADHEPMAHFRSVFPAGRFPDLAEALTRTGSVTTALAEAGVTDYTRTQTRVTAEAADGVMAGHLGLRPGAPVLRTVAVNVDVAGQVVEYGVTTFAGDRVTLSVAHMLS
jgi:GntR family phosphonate transport system transcriptional regulator